MSLYKKYRPQTLAEMKGNAALISQIKAHFAKPNHNHAILLYGASTAYHSVSVSDKILKIFRKIVL